MKKFLSSFLLFGFALATSQSYETLELLLKSFEKQGLKVKEEKEVKSEFPNFDKYLIGLEFPQNHKEVRRYIWISKDGKYILLGVFKRQGNRVVAIEPKKTVVQLSEVQNLNFIKNVEKILKENNIPYTIGHGEKEIYIVWDVFCPFCHEYIKLIKNNPEFKNYTIKLIPFPVHGKASIEGFTYLVWYSKKYGWDKYQKEYMSKNVREDEKKLAKDLQSKYSEIPEEERKKYEKIFVQIRNELIKAGMRGTPTVIKVKEKGENWQGCVNLGAKSLKDFEGWCKTQK